MTLLKISNPDMFEIKVELQILEFNSSYIFLWFLTFSILSPIILSLSPNLHSGMPERYDFIAILPATWEDNTWPCWDINKFTLSRTSRKISLRRYLIPSRRQPIWPVTWLVTWLESSLLDPLPMTWKFKNWIFNAIRIILISLTYIISS